LTELPINSITPNPHQPRQAFDESSITDLANSIATSGILQPVMVRSIADGRYELVVGERRWRAARIAGLEKVPAIVRNVSDRESLQLALVENLQREDLAPLERARGYKQYIDSFAASHDELARELGEHRSTVSNHLRLLDLPVEIQHLVNDRRLGMGQARAIAAITDPERQLAIARLAIRRNLTARQVEELVREGSAVDNDAPRGTSQPSHDRHTSDVESSLSRRLGLLVRLFPGRKKNTGRVVIRYGSLEEFDRIAERLGGASELE